MKDHIEHRSCPSLRDYNAKIDRYIRYYIINRYQWGLKKITPERKNRIYLLLFY
ncbi:IS3 family transposase [Paenibacillus sp. V4I7]|uniref:IS3 family transposase n=1 Tax=Paenibacillus sp. V4I7 TaxID=3042307 RepID=UPI0035948CE7